MVRLADDALDRRQIQQIIHGHRGRVVDGYVSSGTAVRTDETTSAIA